MWHGTEMSPPAIFSYLHVLVSLVAYYVISVGQFRFLWQTLSQFDLHFVQRFHVPELPWTTLSFYQQAMIQG